MWEIWQREAEIGEGKNDEELTNVMYQETVSCNGKKQMQGIMCAGIYMNIGS
jgi:hypothetical protein